MTPAALETPVGSGGPWSAPELDEVVRARRRWQAMDVGGVLGLIATAIVTSAELLVVGITLLISGIFVRFVDHAREGRALVVAHSIEGGPSSGIRHAVRVDAIVVVHRTRGWDVVSDRGGNLAVIARPGLRARLWRHDRAAPTVTDLDPDRAA